MSVQVYSSFEALPERVAAFADGMAQQDFFRSPAWLRILLKTAVPPGDVPRICVAESGERIIAVLIAGERRAAGRLKTHMLLSPGHAAYAATYGPLLDPELGPYGLREIMTAIAAESPSFEVLRFDGLDPASSEFAEFAAAFRYGGMLVQRFFNFDSWCEDLRGLSFTEYLARRPSAIREIGERDLPGVPSSASARFELVASGADITASLIDYALVDLQSARLPEAYPDCIPETVRVTAQLGVLRFGLLYVDDKPGAAQIWIVSGGRATLWRQRHLGHFERLPLQPVLTIAMLRHLFEVDKVGEIRFSRDSSDIAPDWLGGYRERVGMIAFNPRTVRGLVSAMRHVAGHAAISAARRARAAARNRGVG